MTIIEFDPAGVDWQKGGGLVPAIVQAADTREILMLAYMNREALEKTLSSGHVTFFSRSRDCIWQKGETSGNRLRLRAARLDCDKDTILIEADPTGPVCHLGSDTCFGDEAVTPAWLSRLEGVIREREASKSAESHSWKILSGGPPSAAEKFGEEASELQTAAVSESDDRVAEEAADALYHLLLLLHSRRLSLGDVLRVLVSRSG